MALLSAYEDDWAKPMDWLEVRLASPWKLVADNGYDIAASQVVQIGVAHVG